MKNIMTLIAAIAMSTLTIQANEAQPVNITVSSTDAASIQTETPAPVEEDTNATKTEEDKS